MSDRPRPPLAPASSTAALRRVNVATIARLLFVDGPLTRADIGRVTGLARPTVQAALADLLADGTVLEHPLDPTGPGRPAAAFTFDHRQASVLACRRRDDQLELVLADLRGEVIGGPREVSTPPLTELGDVIARVARELVSTTPGAGPVAAVTVLLPGVLERTRGRTTVTDPANGWHDEPVVELLETALEVPVQVATPAGAGLAGVAWQLRRRSTGGHRARSALLVFLDQGLAASACVAGTPAFGAAGDGGEIGHHVVVEDGEPCRCGRRGCLETLAAGWAVLQRVAGLDPPVDTGAATTLAVLEALGRPDVDRVLHAAATALGTYVAALVTAVEPDRVLLGGTGFAAGAEGFLATFRRAVETRRAAIGRHTVTYELAPADADLVGGIAAALGALPARWRDAVAG